MAQKPHVLLSWSSGKDSAWTLNVLRQNPDLEVVGLLKTVNAAFDRVAMHAIHRKLLEAQATALPLLIVPVGEVVERGGFCFAELLLQTPDAEEQP